MSTNLNFRARKSEINLIFEVNEEDCSPPNSPEENNRTGENSYNSKVEGISECQIDQSSVANENCFQFNSLNCGAKEVNVMADEHDMKSNKLDNEQQASVNMDDVKSVIALTTDKFLFSIKFRDKHFADSNKDNIIKAIMNVLSCNIREEVDETCLKIKFWEGKSASDMEITDDSDEGLCLNDTTGVENLFVVDTTPSTNKNLNGQPKFYSRTKYTIEDEKIVCTEQNNARPNCNQSVCFNCDGPHALKDCQEPKNFRRINQARNKHREMKSAKNT